MENSKSSNRVIVRNSDERIYFYDDGENKIQITMDNVDDTNIPIDLRFKYLRNAYRALVHLHDTTNQNVATLQSKMLEITEKNTTLQLQGMQNVNEKTIKDGVINRQLEKANLEIQGLNIRISELMQERRSYKLKIKQLQDHIGLK